MNRITVTSFTSPSREMKRAIGYTMSRVALPMTEHELQLLHACIRAKIITHSDAYKHELAAIATNVTSDDVAELVNRTHRALETFERSLSTNVTCDPPIPVLDNTRRIVAINVRLNCMTLDDESLCYLSNIEEASPTTALAFRGGNKQTSTKATDDIDDDNVSDTTAYPDYCD